MAEIAAIGIVITGTLIVGPRDDSLGKGFEIPLGPISFALAVLVRLFCKRGGHGKVWSLEYHFIP